MEEGNMAAGLVVLCLIVAVYFLPAIIARSRGHRQAGAIFLLNLLLGWTLLGWIAALVWSATNPGQVHVTAPASAPPSAPAKLTAAEEIERYASLKERGMITAEEYEAKKQQILGL